jgi:DNA-binding NarL/FixJ family response regulator
MGASGYLVKDAATDELLRAIEVVARGEALLAPAVTRRLIEAFAAGPQPAAYDPATLAMLTDREREVLALVGSGLSNEEIAGRLVVSPLTARTHVSRILTKTGARDRAQLVVLAYESRLIQPGGAARWPAAVRASARGVSLRASCRRADPYLLVLPVTYMPMPI